MVMIKTTLKTEKREYIKFNYITFTQKNGKKERQKPLYIQPKSIDQIINREDVKQRRRRKAAEEENDQKAQAE